MLLRAFSNEIQKQNLQSECRSFFCPPTDVLFISYVEDAALRKFHNFWAYFRGVGKYFSMPDQRFRREERLKSRKVIKRLFNREGQSFGHYPVRLVWLFLEEPISDFPAQFGMSVPKRQFRNAVHRNRIRRLIREAYRLNKHRLYHHLREEKRQLALMVLYIGKEELPYAQIERAMRGALDRWGKLHRKRRNR